jgi:hypothetical protein
MFAVSSGGSGSHDELSRRLCATCVVTGAAVLAPNFRVHGFCEIRGLWQAVRGSLHPMPASRSSHSWLVQPHLRSRSPRKGSGDSKFLDHHMLVVVGQLLYSQPPFAFVSKC